jgi:hypothetical protein
MIKVLLLLIGCIFSFACRKGEDAADKSALPPVKVRGQSKLNPTHSRDGLSDSVGDAKPPTKTIKEIDLAKFGVGSDRTNALEKLLTNASSETWIKFFNQNSELLGREDYAILQKFNFKDVLSGIDPREWIGSVTDKCDNYIKKSLLGCAAEWARRQGIAATKTLLEKTTSSLVSKNLLETILQLNTLDNPAAAVKSIPEIRQLFEEQYPDGQSSKLVGQANSLITEGMSKISFSSASEAVAAANDIKDNRCRLLAHQGIFKAVYKIDTLKASAWLESLPSSPFKANAGFYLISDLLSEDDVTSADAWYKALQPTLTQTQINDFLKSRSETVAQLEKRAAKIQSSGTVD